MAYFSNGTEGMILDIQCSNCIYKNDEDHNLLCPIHHAHMEFNYDQLDKGLEKLKACLNILVNDEGECQMRKIMIKSGIIK